MIIFAAALLDLFLQPLYPGWVWVMPIALLYMIIVQPDRYAMIIVGTLWCDMWSGYPFGLISGAVLILWFVVNIARKYVQIPR